MYELINLLDAKMKAKNYLENIEWARKNGFSGRIGDYLNYIKKEMGALRDYTD